MKKQFVTHEIATLLKELKFVDPCFATYGFNGQRSDELLLPEDICKLFNERIDYSDIRNDINGNDVAAPLWQQAMEWLRVKHDMHIEFIHAGKPNFYHAFIKDYIYDDFDRHNPKSFEYSEAREAAIMKALRKVKEIADKENEYLNG